MNALPIIIGALCVIAISYRYYSAFIAAKVLALDDSRPVPSQTMYDGHNYYPTNKWVLFGHHFAAISGAGPLKIDTVPRRMSVFPSPSATSGPSSRSACIRIWWEVR